MSDAPTTARTIASLFSGIGGLELGLERAGLGRVVVQVEQDERCRAVLARHWPEARRFDDVRTVGVREIGQVDVICGGFPCQDISLAGKGAGLAGDRSGLWFEYLRIVKEVRPRVVIVENVAALRSRGLDVVLAGLHEAGYWTAWDFIHASDVGAPHRRKRLFIVAVADTRSGRREGSAQPDIGPFGPEQQAPFRHDAYGCDAAVAYASSVGRDGWEVAPGRYFGDGCSAGRHQGAGGAPPGSEVERAALADPASGARLGRTPGDEGHAAHPREVGGDVADAPVEREREPAASADAIAARGEARGEPCGDGEHVADADGERLQGHGRPVGGERTAGAATGSGSPDGPGRRPRKRGPAEPRMGRVPHGVPAGLDGVARFARAVAAEARWPRPPGVDQHAWEPPRTAVGVVKRAARLKALGNAVLPQVAEAVGRWAMYLEPAPVARQRRAA